MKRRAEAIPRWQVSQSSGSHELARLQAWPRAEHAQRVEARARIRSIQLKQ